MNSINQVLQQLSNEVLNWLIRTSEMRIWQTKDRCGNIAWDIYDPKTAHSTHFHSEQEARIWIDEQYYRH